MNEIDLMKQKSSINSNGKRLQQNRPLKVDVTRVAPNSKKWTQCKILGKNISIRSYSAGTVFLNKLYIYGGYQILNGVMDDFYYISLDKQLQQYSWVSIPKKGDYPGHRARHTLIASSKKIYLFGGLQTDTRSTNSIFQFDPQTQTWKKIETVGQKIPCLDSFGSTLVKTGDQQKIIIFGGYDQNKYEFTNAVYQYNIHQNKWSILSPHMKKDNKYYINPRSGCSICSDSSSIFIFGGRDQQQKMNDLWEFDLKTFKFNEIYDRKKNPITRNGHSLTFHNDVLYLFGGIHDITWQLDDLHMFDIKKKEWIVIQYDSPRKVQNKSKLVESPTTKKNNLLQNNSLKKKSWYETSPNAHNKRSMLDQSPSNKASITHFGNQDQSPGKMIDQQRKKAFLNKKAEMLKNFQTNDKQQQKYIQMQTASQAMKNSLDVIGNVSSESKGQQGKLSEFGKTTVSKFLQPLSNSNKQILGKRPCARDGHVSVKLGNQIIIFGGDRHQMSFNDIYRLDLQRVKGQIEK